MTDIRKTLTLLKNINKYGIFALTLICIIYLSPLLFVTTPILIISPVSICTILDVAGSLNLRLTLSKVFGLCWVHRLCIIYIFLISFCVATLRHNIFNILGVDIKLIEGLLFGIGLLLIPLTFWKLKNKNC